MKIKRHSKNSVFLFEIILNLLLFSMLITVGLSFFIKTHTLTNKTSQLHHAVACCSNVATVFEAGNGTLDNLMDLYPYSICMNDKMIIYLDENYNEISSNNYTYSIIITLLSEQEYANLHKIDITFYDDSSSEIYSIKACNYNALTPSSLYKEVVQ